MGERVVAGISHGPRRRLNSQFSERVIADKPDVLGAVIRMDQTVEVPFGLRNRLVSCFQRQSFWSSRTSASISPRSCGKGIGDERGADESDLSSHARGGPPARGECRRTASDGASAVNVRLKWSGRPSLSLRLQVMIGARPGRTPRIPAARTSRATCSRPALQPARLRACHIVRTPQAPHHPDLLGRDFTASAPNRLWVTDLTYVSTRTRCCPCLFHQ